MYYYSLGSRFFFSRDIEAKYNEHAELFREEGSAEREASTSGFNETEKSQVRRSNSVISTQRARVLIKTAEAGRV